MSIEAKLRRDMVALFDAYMSGVAVAPTTLSMRAIGDARFYTKLRLGRDGFTARSYDKVVAWFSQAWPDGLPWPNGVERIDPRQIARRPRKPRAVSPMARIPRGTKKKRKRK